MIHRPRVLGIAATAGLAAVLSFAAVASAAPVNTPNTAYSSYSQPGGYAHACTHGRSTYSTPSGATVYVYERAASNVSWQHVHLVFQSTTVLSPGGGYNVSREVWLVC